MLPPFSWYRVCVEGVDDKSGYLATYWARAAHLGDAIDAALGAAREVPFDWRDVYPVWAGPGRHEDDAVVRLSGGSSLMTPGAFVSYPLAKGPRSFPCPRGVIPSTDAGEEVVQLQVGYESVKSDVTHCLRVSLDATRFEATVAELVTRMPQIDRVGVLLSGEWLAVDEDVVWRSSAIRAPGELLGFLLRTKEEILANGFAQIAVSCDARRVLLVVDDHKAIHIRDENRVRGEMLAQFLASSGIPLVAGLRTVADRVYHYHYSSAACVGPKSVQETLLKEGFEMEPRLKGLQRKGQRSDG